VRAELAIPQDAPVVGVVARFHPDKDHRNFVAAARRVAAANPKATFVLAGDAVEPTNDELRRWIDDSGLHDSVRLLGRRSDVPDLLTAVDVLASPSRTEGFPQVLGEAMLCGVPCAVTDCGDSRAIVGRTGRVVPPGDPGALGGAILEMLALAPAERTVMGVAARESICARYDIGTVTRQYVELYEDVVAQRRSR
jgi:glycosyltransferase involved in cell wall biosynthesis